jgi:hypothetical protein
LDYFILFTITKRAIAAKVIKKIKLLANKIIKNLLVTLKNLTLNNSNLLGWTSFVEAVKLCIQPLIEFEELDLIRNLLIEFYNHYAR